MSINKICDILSAFNIICIKKTFFFCIMEIKTRPFAHFKLIGDAERITLFFCRLCESSRGRCILNLFISSKRLSGVV